jgi:hypothetical protein
VSSSSCRKTSTSGCASTHARNPGASCMQEGQMHTLELVHHSSFIIHTLPEMTHIFTVFRLDDSLPIIFKNDKFEDPTNEV